MSVYVAHYTSACAVAEVSLRPIGKLHRELTGNQKAASGKLSVVASSYRLVANQKPAASRKTNPQRSYKTCLMNPDNY